MIWFSSPLMYLLTLTREIVVRAISTLGFEFFYFGESFGEAFIEIL
jgi:hypothetical protein